jgi:hypothetical protein
MLKINQKRLRNKGNFGQDFLLEKKRADGYIALKCHSMHVFSAAIAGGKEAELIDDASFQSRQIITRMRIFLIISYFLASFYLMS